MPGPESRADLAACDVEVAPKGATPIDLEGGCADGVCPAMTWTQVVDTLGEAEHSRPVAVDFGTWRLGSVGVHWRNGIELSFSDANQDGRPDPEATIWSVGLGEGFTGVTDEGVGVGQQLDCAVQSLGDPDAWDVGADGTLCYAWYEDVGLALLDEHTNGTEDGRPDGLIDTMSLYGVLPAR